MYHFFLGDIHFPIAPDSFKVRVGSNDREVDLVSGEDINILKAPGLKEISFKALLPEMKYPFCSYYGGFITGREIVRRIGEMKKKKEPVRFIVFRHRGLKYMGHVNISVSVDEYSVEESAEQGFDSVIDIKLKEYRYFYTRKYSENQSGSVSPVGTAAETERQKRGTVVVQSGDTLWDIAKRYYGDGSQYTKIYEANKNAIDDPRVIKPGLVLLVP